MKRLIVILFTPGLLVLMGGCRQDMHDQPRIEPLQASSWFDDGRGSREPLEGTIARGSLREDVHLYEGKVDGELAREFPFEMTRDVIERGGERYGIYCTPCHGKDGSGLGVVVQRGFKKPPTFHSARLREVPAGHFFDVMTNGFGVMQDYATQVPVRDRWAIAGYIRALQLSQHASVEDVPADARESLGLETEE